MMPKMKNAVVQGNPGPPTGAGLPRSVPLLACAIGAGGFDERGISPARVPKMKNVIM